MCASAKDEEALCPTKEVNMEPQKKKARDRKFVLFNKLIYLYVRSALLFEILRPMDVFCCFIYASERGLLTILANKLYQLLQ